MKRRHSSILQYFQKVPKAKEDSKLTESVESISTHIDQQQQPIKPCSDQQNQPHLFNVDMESESQKDMPIAADTFQKASEEVRGKNHNEIASNENSSELGSSATSVGPNENTSDDDDFIVPTKRTRRQLKYISILISLV
jgi:hypothetical protein